MQYSFSSGEAVDAIVRAGEYIIPVDAKFSLDNYNKMVESSDAAEIAVLENDLKKILSHVLMKQPNIFALSRKQQTTLTCLFLQMVFTKIY